MNKAVQISKRNELFSLIKKVGDFYGENIEFLREYTKEILSKYELDELLVCFRELASQTKYIKYIANG